MDASAIGSDLIIASGSTVASPGTWSSLGCIENITPNRISQAYRERRPCINATSRKVRKVRDGGVDYGSFSATLRFDADTLDDVLADLEEGTDRVIGYVLGETGRALVALVGVEEIGAQPLADGADVLLDVSFIILDTFTHIAAPTLTP